MSRITTLLLGLLTWLVATPARADLKIAASVPTLAAIAREVGQGKVTVSSLSLHTQDPHSVDAKPSLVLLLNRADLLLSVGLQLEAGWLPTLQRGARNAKINVGARGHLDCSTLVKLREKPVSVDRSKGDIHPRGNPHYLFDPRQLAQVAIGVTARMAELDPAKSATYNAGLARFLKGLHKTRKRLQRQMKASRGAPIIAYHKSWAYFSHWLGLMEVAFLEPKPGIPPNPGHVARVLVAARKHRVKVVIQEGFYPSATGKLIANKAGASLVVLPGGVDFRGGQTVTQYFDKLISAVAKGLSG